MNDTFPKRPVVRSVKAANEATALIVQLRQQQQRAESDLENELQTVRLKHAARFLVKVGTDRISVGERIQQLETALNSYLNKNAPKVFHGTQRHRHLPGGTIQLKSEAGSIEFETGHNRRTAAAELVNVEGWATAVAELLEAFGLTRWVVLQPDLNWDGLKRGIKANQIDPEELRPYGMYWDQNDNVLRIQKPRDQWKQKS